MQKGIVCAQCQQCFGVRFREQRGASRQPLLLKCAHTFCESCLLRIAKQERKSITCPTCKTVTDLADGEKSVRKLPCHFYITGYLVSSQNTLVEQELNRRNVGMTAVKKKDSSTDKIGRPCSECHINKATCKCVKCDCVMCGLCFDKVRQCRLAGGQVHSLSKSLKMHQAMPITDNNTCPSPFEDVSPICKLHGKPIEYFCDDDDISICSRCVILGDHKDHSITSMEEKNRVLLEDLEPALQYATQVVKKVAKSDKVILDAIPTVKSETSSAIAEIRKHFQGLHAALQTRESELIDQVYACFEEGVSPVVNMRSELAEDKKKLEQAIRAAHRIMNNNNEVILNARDILQGLNRAKEVACIAIRGEPDTETGGIRFEGDTSLLDTFKSYGSVEGTVPRRVKFHTLETAPEDLLSDSTETASVASYCSVTSGTTDVTSTADTGEDVIIEDERDILVDQDDDAPKPKFTLKPIPGKAKMQGHCENVIVTHIQNPKKFNVQRCSLASKLHKMSKDINTWCKGLATEDDIPTDPVKDDFVLCQYSHNKNWYRGRVLSVMTTTETTPSGKAVKKHIEVLFFDYGNQEIVTIDRLRNMEKRFMKYPEFLLECSLCDIEPAGKDGLWARDAPTIMYKMCEQGQMLMTVMREVGNVLEVDLHNPTTDSILDDRPASLRDSLVFLEFAKFVTSPEQQYKPTLPSIHKRRDYMKPEPRQKGDVFEARISYPGVPSGFCVQPLGDDADYVMQKLEEMQQTYNDGRDIYKIYCPEVDMICVVQSPVDDSWHRARVLDLPGGRMVDVQYVDHGHIDRVSYERIRSILDEYLRSPPLAVQCELSGVVPTEEDSGWGVECLEWWTDLTTSLNFRVKILDVQVDVIEVILYRILDDTADNLSVNYQLVANSYAKSTGVGSSVLGPNKPTPTTSPKKTYRSTRKDKQERSSDVAATYMTASQIDEDNVNDMTNTFSLYPSSTSSTTPSVSNTSSNPTSNTTSNTTTPSTSPPPSRKQPNKNKNKNQNKLKMDVAAAATTAECATTPTDLQSPTESNLEVKISAFVSPANFHVQLLDTKELESVMKNLKDQVKNMPQPSTKKWKVKDFCAAKSNKDQQWYRGKIIDRVDEKFKVYFVDFGFEEFVERDHLRELDIKMRQLSCSSIRCHLAFITATGSSDPLVWSATSCEFMQNEIKDKTLYIKREGDMVSEDRGVPVDLLIMEIIPETALEPCQIIGHSLIDKMKEKGLAIPCRNRKRGSDDGQKPPSPEVLFMDSPFLECEIQKYTLEVLPPVNTDLIVIPTYVDYQGVIYCQPVEDDTTFVILTEDLQTVYVESKPQRVDWQSGQALVSYFKADDLWYRAMFDHIDEKDPSKAKVKYYDYGNSETLELTKLRLPVREFLEQPRMCIECVLHNICPVSEDGKWPISVLDYIHNLIVNHNCHIHIKKSEAGSPVGIDLVLPDGSDLSTTLIYTGMALKPDNLCSNYELSHKINLVLEKRFPFKKTVLAPVDEFFPVAFTSCELPNVVWFQHTQQNEVNIDLEVVERASQINSELSALVNIASELHNTETIGKPFIKVPAVGQMCSAKFSFDECWYRGLVVDRVEDAQTALILFVDYGNTELVPLDRLRVLTASMRCLPAQGVRCYINGLIPPDGEALWSLKSMELMIHLLINKQLFACFKSIEPLTVELYEQTDENEGRLELAYQPLIDLGLAVLDNKPLDHSELADLALTVGQKEEEIKIEMKDPEMDADVVVETEHDKEILDAQRLQE